MSNQTEEAEVPMVDLSELINGWSPTHVSYFGPLSRCIHVGGVVNEEMTAGVCSQLLTLDAIGDEPITIYINTDGGKIVDGLAIYDMARAIAPKVITVAMGACYSAGLLILQAGDQRYAMPNASFFYHQPIMGGQLISPEVARGLTELYENSVGVCDNIIRKRSGMAIETWDKHFTGKIQKYFSPEEAYQYGVIDHIIKPRDK